MLALSLHEMHASLGARFGVLGGAEIVSDYRSPLLEHQALTESAGVLDLSFRGRICLMGADRVRLLHGQVTNDIQRLKAGDGCYAALTTAKGKMQADLNVHALAEELLLDFEPGLTQPLLDRFNHYIVADDVQAVDVAPYYGLISIQGPAAASVAAALDMNGALPSALLASVKYPVAEVGDIYVVKNARLGGDGFDLYIPLEGLGMVFDKAIAAAKASGGGPVGWTAFEWARIEAGIPRFGADMDETNLPPEAGIESRAISYTKGCYIGQETIARIKTYGQVTKALRGLLLPDELPAMPARGDKLTLNGREVGYVTGAIRSPKWKKNIALGYVRKECNQPGKELALKSAGAEHRVVVSALPWKFE